MSDAPIGIFDSGVGGLTVARAVIDQLPNESVLYVGDTLRGPYGPRPLAQVRAFALDVMDHLLAEGVKLIVIACNSASAAVLRDARERYDIPVIEVIQPAVRQAVHITQSRRVGVIGTNATIDSMAYDDAFAAAPDISLYSRACPRFVDFVEGGVVEGTEVEALAREYLEPLIAQDIDTLVLGCTHYPLLADVIALVVGPEVTLVNSASETAKQVAQTLQDSGLQRSGDAGSPEHRFVATGDPKPFEVLGQRFLGPEVIEVERHPRRADTVGFPDNAPQ
ncbi:MAG: glutamate racemase [actinobacterium acAMD-2]|nr:MAG: glutamate racemase [actinobacterium acAMD-2]HAS07689.1 glutamate racemase [Actinomycetota bacterium]